MNLFAVFFVLGASAWLRVPALPPPEFAIFLLLPLVHLLQAVLRDQVTRIGRMLAATAAGMLLAWHVAAVELGYKLPPFLHGTDVELEVAVLGLPEVHLAEADADGRSLARARFRVSVRKVLDAPAGFQARRLQLSWYGPAGAAAGQRMRAGDEWRLRIRLRAPRGLMNPGGFDYAGWLFRERIHATGYVRAASTNALQHAGNERIGAARQAVREQLAVDAGSLRYAGLLQALLVGQRSGVAADDWQLLRDTGTSHLLAISGLHIGMVAAWAMLLGGVLLRGLAVAGVFFHRLDVGAVFAVAAALGYAVLAGFTLPTQRALCMLIVWLGFRYWRRHRSRVTPLASAALLVVMADPLATLSPGFWLSFGAVGALLYLSQQQRYLVDVWRRLLALLRMHVALSLVMLPLTALFFGQASVIAPLANFIAIPVISLAVVPLLLVWVLLRFTLALAWKDADPGFLANLPALADYCLSLLLALLQKLAALPYASIPQREVALLWTLAALAGLALGFLPRCRERWLALPFILPFVWLQLSAHPPAGMRLDVLDVGQGLAVIIRVDGKTLLVDTGGNLTPELTMAEAVVAPYLRAEGIRRLDRVLISHRDADHAAGIDYLQQQWPVDRWILPAEQKLASVDSTTHSAHFSTDICTSGLQWRWGLARFSLLAPAVGQTGSSNNRSCVLQIRYGSHVIVLPGDIEKPGERQLVRHQIRKENTLSNALAYIEEPWHRQLRSQLADVQLPAALLLAPHHGSKTSSSSAWLERVRPERVVYTVGFRNRFGFPHESVQLRYKEWGARAYRTDRDGALRFQFLLNQPVGEPRRHRVIAKRLWHSPWTG